MKLLILLSICLTTLNGPQQEDITDDFETGFKYVVDNLSTFEGMNADEFIVAVNKKFGMPEAYRIRPLSKVLEDGGYTWSPGMTAILRELNTAINDSKSYEDFIKGLTIFENNTSQLGSGERQDALNYARFLRSLMNLLYHELQYYNLCCDMEATVPQFWPRLGKCAAGVIGGAGAGALGGAAVGAGIAGVGAAVGAVIGGIAGAYNGVAAFCD